MSRSPLPDVPRCAKFIQLTRPDNIHEVYQGLWPREKTKETNTTVLGRIGGGTDGGEVLRTTIQDGDRSGKGVPAIPNSILQHDQRGGEGGAARVMRYAGVTERARLYVGLTQHCFLCR